MTPMVPPTQTWTQSWMPSNVLVKLMKEVCASAVGVFEAIMPRLAKKFGARDVNRLRWCDDSRRGANEPTRNGLLAALCPVLIGQCHIGVNGLQRLLQLQKVNPMPRQEAQCVVQLMRLGMNVDQLA